MHKFHQIPTDQFVPISHDNSYLFTHYDKVANFLAFNLEKNYKNILSKPVQNGYTFEWFSGFEGLIDLKQHNKETTDFGLNKYWEFKAIIQSKIEQLAHSTHDDGKNWASLLTKVFNHQDNFIFSNGQDISIVWGWKFNNNENYKPKIADKPVKIPQTAAPVEEFKAQDDKNKEEKVTIATSSEEIPTEEEVSQELLYSEPQEEPKTLKPTQQSNSFLEFLRWFAAKYWWLLWLLTVLVAIVFFIKAYNVNS